MSKKNSNRVLRRSKKRRRIRKKISGTSGRPRLAVFRSAGNIYAQLIDDVSSKTLTGVSTLSPDLRTEVEKSENRVVASKLVGKAIAERAKKLKIKNVVFDRGGYLYHGRVKALADGARENGLEF